jgi:hypothetical protein
MDRERFIHLVARYAAMMTSDDYTQREPDFLEVEKLSDDDYRYIQYNAIEVVAVTLEMTGEPEVAQGLREDRAKFIVDDEEAGRKPVLIRPPGYWQH